MHEVVPKIAERHRRLRAEAEALREELVDLSLSDPPTPEAVLRELNERAAARCRAYLDADRELQEQLRRLRHSEDTVIRYRDYIGTNRLWPLD